MASSKTVPRLIGTALAAASLVVPLLPGFPPFWVTLLDYAALSAMVALGLVVLTGIGRMLGAPDCTPGYYNNEGREPGPAAKLNVGNAVRTVIVAELVGAPLGIGKELDLAKNVFDMPTVLAWTLFLVLMALVMSNGIEYAEQRILRWRGDSHGRG